MKFNDIIMFFAAAVWFSGCGLLALHTEPTTERVVYTITVYEGIDETGEYWRSVSRFENGVSEQDQCDIIRAVAHECREYYGPKCQVDE